MDVGGSWGYAVVPIILGDSLRTIMLADRLLKRGYNAFPIVPPGVPEQSARLRFFISSEHSVEADIEGAVGGDGRRIELNPVGAGGQCPWACMAKVMMAKLRA